MSSIHVSLDRGVNKELVLTFRDYSSDGPMAEPVYEHKIPPAEQSEFLVQVANLVYQNLRSVANEISYGDCSTCGNTRLVNVPKGSGQSERTESVHCPDCKVPIPAAFAHYPVIGGGFSDDPRGTDA